MSDEGPPLSLDQVRSAAAGGRLVALAHQLVADHRWSSLEVLLTLAATPSLPIEDVAAALESVLGAWGELPEPERNEGLRELREAQLHAANALVRRSEQPPITERQRAALRIAAGLLSILGEARRAAELYEKAGDEARAAETWGELGELERMEACLLREEQRRAERLRVADLRRRFDLLVLAGERLAAVNAVAGVNPVDLDSQDLVARGRALDGRLVRGRAVTLRLPDRRVLRVAALPAVLGREPTVEIPVREPTVSRRHARLSELDGIITLEDAGSRGGTRLGGFRVAGRLPLRDEGDIDLGVNCRLRFRAGPGAVVTLHGTSGLDRDHFTICAAGPVVVSELLGSAAPVQLSFAAGVARLERPAGETLSLDGRLVGPRCDLLHGETVESSDGLKLEVL
jgi:hypothetical protein